MRISKMYPRLVVAGAAAAIDFYKDVFGATETERFAGDDGRIVHAELLIGGAPVGIKDEGDGDPAPPTLGGTPVVMALDVDDPDGIAAAMEAAGATVVFPVSDHPYGRGGRLTDPWGHQWMLMRP